MSFVSLKITAKRLDSPPPRPNLPKFCGIIGVYAITCIVENKTKMQCVA